MKPLLDENLPKRLKIDLSEHEVYTVRDKGWNGLKNGELLKLLIADNFQVLITFNKNLQYQQNFLKCPIPVVVLVAQINIYAELSKLIPLILGYLSGNKYAPGAVIIQSR
jgi:hypothetical protein